MTSDAAARRAARKAGLFAIKSRKLIGTADNRGGFQLVDEHRRIIAGERLDLSADDVVKIAQERRAR